MGYALANYAAEAEGGENELDVTITVVDSAAAPI